MLGLGEGLELGQGLAWYYVGIGDDRELDYVDPGESHLGWSNGPFLIGIETIILDNRPRRIP